MILSGKEIEKQVEKGRIIIEPFERRNLNPNSYNYRLGIQYVIVNEKHSLDGDRGDVSLRPIPEEGLLLQPGRVYLASTHEIIGSSTYVTSLIGRSSVGRLGLFLQISSDLGNLGPAHKWTLELTCVQPIIIYPHMKIGQVSFWDPEGDVVEYNGQYTSFNTPKSSIYSLLFTEEE
jgi:dCTP deaminase